MPFLTIGIPTYNRKHALAENVLEILSDDFLNRNDIGLVVSDNCSDDGTFETITKIKHQSSHSANMRVLSNKENIGVFRNIFQLFDRSESDYLLVTSDEDFVLKNHLPGLISFLREKQPSFVSPQFLRNAGLYRGKKVSRSIAWTEYENSSFYLSGLVFNVRRTRKVLEVRLPAMMDKNLFYPQTLIAAELMVTHPGTLWFYDRPVTEMRYSFPTHVSTDHTYPYWSIPGRWESFVAVEHYFTTRLLSEESLRGKEVLGVFLRQNRLELYGLFLHAIKATRPEILEDFQFGVYKKEIGVGFLAGMNSLVRKGLEKGRAAVKELRLLR